jgi:hypothetical protein
VLSTGIAIRAITSRRPPNNHSFQSLNGSIVVLLLVAQFHASFRGVATSAVVAWIVCFELLEGEEQAGHVKKLKRHLCKERSLQKSRRAACKDWCLVMTGWFFVFEIFFGWGRWFLLASRIHSQVRSPDSRSVPYLNPKNMLCLHASTDRCERRGRTKPTDRTVAWREINTAQRNSG